MRALSHLVPLALAGTLALPRPATAQTPPAPPPGQPAPAPAPPAARPARPATLAELDARLARLAAELDELRQSAVAVPELQKTVGELAAQVAALRQDVDALVRAGAGQVELVARLDALDARVAQIGEQVTAARADLENRTGPESEARASGGGGGGGWDDGFVLVASDRYSLRLSGFVQMRHQLRTAEAAAADETFPEVLEAGFSLRRARLQVDGQVHSKRLTYKVQAEYAGANVRLLDFVVEGKLARGFYLRAGQFKVPFARSFMGSESMQSFLESPVATETLRYDRDIGLVGGWVGAGGKLDLTVGVFNGAGRNVSGNDNLDPLLVGRAQYALLGKPWKPEEGDLPGTRAPALIIGVGGTFENAPVPAIVGYGDTALSETSKDDLTKLDADVDGDGARDNVRVAMFGIDLSFRYRGLGIEAEWYARSEDWGAIPLGQPNPLDFDPSRSYLGGFVQASYFVLPGRLSLGARYSATGVSPLLLGGRKHEGAPEDDKRRETSALISYFRHGHGIELTAMYSFIDWYDRGDLDQLGLGEQRLIIEAQVAF